MTTRRRVPSLRLRLGSLLAVLSLAGATALYFGAIAYGRSAADDSYDRLLSGAVISIAETLSVTQQRVEVDVPYAAFDMLSAAPQDSVYYRVFLSDGRTITGYSDLPRPPSPDGKRRSLDSTMIEYFNAPYRGATVRFAVLARQTYEPALHGRIFVEVGQTREARDVLAHQIAMRAMIPILLVTIIALGAIWIGIDLALRPLEHIGSELVKRHSSDLRPIEDPVPAEIQPLVDAINEFIRRLQASIEALRAFIAEAAHQIRTPLAALRAQAQVANLDDMSDLQRSLGSVERNATKLTRLVNQLLSDAIVSHRTDLVQRETFDLIAVIRMGIRDAVPLTSDADVSLRTKFSEARFAGDPLLLGEATKNLIDNAITHGCGPVTVELSGDDEEFLLSVCDQGGGIPPARREHVWQRFARASETAGGAGLGMAIVRRAIDRHGGRIELRDREGGGFCVECHLPRQA